MTRDCPPHHLARRRARRGGRRSLQFRRFAWAGATILLTGIVCGLAAWLTSTIEVFATRFRGLREFVILGPLPALQADPTLLARALVNLLDDARLHGGGVARLRVSTRPGPSSSTSGTTAPGSATTPTCSSSRSDACRGPTAPSGSRIGFWMAAPAENGAEPPGVR